MIVNLYTALGALKTGMDILKREEGVQSDRIIWDTAVVQNQRGWIAIMADAMEILVQCNAHTGNKRSLGNCTSGRIYDRKKCSRTLDQYLEEVRYLNTADRCSEPEEEGVKGYRSFMNDIPRGFLLSVPQWNQCRSVV